jgi:hypothetical protein
MKLLLSIAGLFFCTAVAAQTVEENLVQALDSFALLRPQEKAYSLTDRKSYVAGETIWTSSFVTLEGKPSVLSKVLYITLSDATGKIISKKMQALKNGQSSGNIDIPENILSGTYYLRTYTLWMQNFPAFIAVEPISILNTDYSKTKPIAPSKNYNIGFFPEGGNLVAGVKSIVAFKTIDGNGLPVTATGKIINQKNETIATITTAHDGMGSFEFTPLTGVNYTAKISFNGQAETTATLPAIQKEGVVIDVDNANVLKTFVHVQRGETNPDKYNTLLVVAQLNYQVVYMGKLNLDELQDAVAINKKTLPSGIMQITVLNDKGQPLAERLAFIANYDTQQQLLQPVIINATKRKLNSIEVDATSFSGLTASASIINNDATAPPHGNNILSQFLLASDIKGYVHNPGYYFSSKEAGVLKNLDYIMLTNGWRRYNWADIAQYKYSPLSYPFEQSMSIAGKVKGVTGSGVLKDGKVNLYVKGEDSTSIMAEAKLNAQSNFVVDNLNFKGEATVYYQGTNVKNAGAITEAAIYPSYFDTLKKSDVVLQLSTTTSSNSIYKKEIDEKAKLDAQKGKVLEEVIVKAKRLSETDSLNNLYASDIFLTSDQTIAVNTNIPFYSMWQLLQRSIPGININETDTGVQVNFGRYEGLDFFSSNTSGSSVLFFLNEIAVDANIINTINPADVALIKVFKGATAIGLGADRGAIGVYTIKGKSGRDWRDKGFDFVKRKGYTATREFYHMDYSKLNPESYFTDERTTLYWNPLLPVNKNGKIVIQFYNDDKCTQFNVIISGIDANGKLLHIEKVIQ